MTQFPGSPRTLSGALVAFDGSNPIPSVVTFQYNPQMLTRTLKPRGVEGEGGIGESYRLSGAPEETIQLEAELDATDALEESNPLAVTTGLHSQLAALEGLIYPKSSTVIANTVLMALGTIEIIPPSAPFTLFVWGLQRVLPVRLNEFSITEEAFDTLLNPIRARVSLGMRVLSYNDLSISHPGYYVFLGHQIVKETMSKLGTVNDLTAVAGDALDLF